MCHKSPVFGSGLPWTEAKSLHSLAIFNIPCTLLSLTAWIQVSELPQAALWSARWHVQQLRSKSWSVNGYCIQSGFTNKYVLLLGAHPLGLCRLSLQLWRHSFPQYHFNQCINTLNLWVIHTKNMGSSGERFNLCFFHNSALLSDEHLPYLVKLISWFVTNLWKHVDSPPRYKIQPVIAVSFW